MAELTAFAYRPGASVLHRLDVRMKLSLRGRRLPLVGLRLDFAGARADRRCRSWPSRPAAAREPAASAGRAVRWVACCWRLVFVARALSTEGAPGLLALGLVVVTGEGLRDGLLVCLRLVLVFLLGSLLVATTRSAEIKAGVQWFLKPLPFISAERVGDHAGPARAVHSGDLRRGLAHDRMPSGPARWRTAATRLRRTVMLGIPLHAPDFRDAPIDWRSPWRRAATPKSRTGPELRAGRRDWAALAAWLRLAGPALLARLDGIADVF
ncbi:MAG: hypothetical protein MZV70_18970 [Desulfobacterales bacterium]|nr:hypothetical protein [Desulfobacterales bacterium]